MSAVAERIARRSATVTAVDLDELPPERHRVYFALHSDSGQIKIGCSFDPDLRLVELERYTNAHLVLLTTVVGGFDLERALHVRFAALRHEGEWFAPGPDLTSYIAAAASP